MRLRYAGTCRECGAELAAGVAAIYERPTRSVRCLTCPRGGPGDHDGSGHSGGAGAVDAGVAGASALREFERRRDARQARVRAEHPRLGGLILALSDHPQSTKAWGERGAREQRLAARLNRLAGPTVRVLHDRRIPAAIWQPSGFHVDPIPTDASRHPHHV